jgi:hypothetical protein
MSCSKLTIIPDTRYSENDMVKKYEQYQNTAHVLNFGYLHGKLQDLVGYDICMTLEPNEGLKEGIYDADFDGTDCKLFWWETERPNNHKGLVVFCSDVKGMHHAEKCYNNKVFNI